MGNYYFSRALENDRAIFIAPLSDIDVQASGEALEDASGYFLYQRCYRTTESQITVLARLQSEEAALEMCHLLNLS